MPVSFWQQLTELPLYDWARQHQLATAAIEGAHLASSAFFFGAIILLDLRVLGFGRRLIVANLARLTLTMALVAFVFVALTGLFMFGLDAPKWSHTPEFWLKMSLIALAGINAAALHLTTWRNVDVWGIENRPTPLNAKLFVLGSVAMWVAVAILGRYLGYATLTPARFFSEGELDLLLRPGGPLDIF
jgi:hypothetical protein